MNSWIYLYCTCPYPQVRQALFGMLKAKKIPIINSAELNNVGQFPYVWINDIEAGFGSIDDKSCGSSLQGTIKPTSLESFIQCINSWQVHVRFMVGDNAIRLFDNGNVNINSTFISDTDFDKIVLERKKLTNRPLFHSKKKQPAQPIGDIN